MKPGKANSRGMHERRCMIPILQRVFGVFMAVVMSLPGGAVLAANNPVDENWWPSKHGPEDERGATGTITPEKRLEAVKLVRKGRTLTLGMPYQQGMPMVSGRTFRLTLPAGGRPRHGPMPWHGEGFDLTFNDELLTAEIGQVGTQFDGLGHVMIRIEGQPGLVDGNYMYNGRRLEDAATESGLRFNGVEHAAAEGFFTRGILIDMPAFLGIERMAAGEEVTVADYLEALRRQAIDEAGPGDVVLIRTGWIQLWKNNLGSAGHIVASPAQLQAANAQFGTAEPGVSAELCDYLAQREIAILGADQGAIEPVAVGRQQHGEPFGYCHVNLVARRGIYLFENLDLEGLADAGVYEFLFTWAPLKLVGATGSPGNPMVAW